MGKFRLDLWHVILFFVTIVIGIVKADITNYFSSLKISKQLKEHEGEKIEIMSCSGEWEEVTILSVDLGIPVLRGAAVFFLHLKVKDTPYWEKMPIANWKSQRVKFLRK